MIATRSPPAVGHYLNMHTTTPVIEGNITVKNLTTRQACLIGGLLAGFIGDISDKYDATKDIVSVYESR
jgi:hypothetical protein